MPLISVTRLRIRSLRFLPGFALYSSQSLRQVKKAAGFQQGRLLPDRNWTFWTLTAWDDEQSMRQFMTAGAHKKAMLKLIDWCDEASVVHWQQDQADLPSWAEVDQRMRLDGRPSKLRNPSPGHATLAYRTPRLTRGGQIRRS